jgi:hypothetical protein
MTLPQIVTPGLDPGSRFYFGWQKAAGPRLKAGVTGEEWRTTS